MKKVFLLCLLFAFVLNTNAQGKKSEKAKDKTEKAEKKAKKEGKEAEDKVRLKKDGTPDKRYTKDDKSPLKKDGTPDK
ncbi:MAG: hypothetical protein KA213_06675, partial [Flavobacterium sp.]|nr:hypothetical protein [Flavobacterium sp.]